MNDLETVELYRGELWECQFYSTVLEDNGIEHFTRNSTYSHYGPITAPAQMVIIMVFRKDFEKAISLLKNTMSNIEPDKAER